jgi:starch-binding outer membrane protein, SusD/RagB family
MKRLRYTTGLLIAFFMAMTSCSKDIIDLQPRGTVLESNFYKTEAELFQGLVAAYDPLGFSTGFTMKMGLLNAASDDTHAGGSDASDQPNWVAYDKFTMNPNLGPQAGLWSKNFIGIYRANLVLQKAEGTDITGLTPDKKARYIAEAKFLRAYYYFDLVRWFGNVPLITATPSADAIYKQVQSTPTAIYAQIEKDLKEAIAATQLPESLAAEELGRITKGAAKALLGKVILFQNTAARMGEAATLFEEVINSNNYALEKVYADIFKPDNKFGKESIFEIYCSGNRKGDWGTGLNGNGIDGNEGNKDVQFFGMRDFVGAVYANGWSFCPVSLDLVSFMQNDPRFAATVIDGKALKAAGASYTSGFQNTDYFIKKYAPLAAFKVTSGEPALNWGYNIKEIRLADVLLMAAECFNRSGNDAKAQTYLNRVRTRVALPAKTSAGVPLLEDIYAERRLELATEGMRFWDLLRTNKAATVLAGQGFKTNKHELLPIPQSEIDIMQGGFKQNAGY